MYSFSSQDICNFNSAGQKSCYDIEQYKFIVCQLWDNNMKGFAGICGIYLTAALKTMYNDSTRPLLVAMPYNSGRNAKFYFINKTTIQITECNACFCYIYGVLI